MKTRRIELIAWIALIGSLLALWQTYLRDSPRLWSASTAQGTTQSLESLQQANRAALISDSFNYQGILRDSNGSLLTGNYTMTLKIYSGATGGTPLFTQSTSNVSVRDGLFNVVLGNAPGNPLGSTVFANSPRYLGIAITPDAEMTPRQEIHAVPWALTANTALTANSF